MLLFTAVACSKQVPILPIIKQNPYPGYTQYFIPAKQHYALNNSFDVIDKKELHFMAIFDSSCIYTSYNPENIYDINKLYGFSDCNTLHHENSARVGWLWNGKAIELYAYCYVDSVRKSKMLGTIPIGTPAELTINVQSTKYMFTYKGVTTTMPRHCNGAGIQGYRLYPYFGGDETAPHDIRVYIKEL